MKTLYLVLIAQIGFTASFAQSNSPKTENTTQVKTANGTLEGTIESSGIRSFKGVPFAQAPVGELRWKGPQPVKNWTGVRKADHFGPRAMQKPIFSDMVFRSDGVSEDCLYLNVWTPAKTSKEKLPVLVYFYGGGFVGGDGSELRYDGENMAQKGIVTLTVNYRLGVFGFMAHPDLSKESPHHASGNYGLMDQNAALRWVKQNIAAFGGDPEKITIAGESAGSISVFAQMASPLSKNLIAGAIGESGAMIKPTAAPLPLAEAEQRGVAFAEKINLKSLSQLRALSAQELLDAASKPGAFNTAATIDGYFLPELPAAIFAAGKQAHVPLLVGWNSAEVQYNALLGGDMPTLGNYKNKLKQLYGERADEVLKLYPAANQEEVIKAATALASDRFIAFSTWKWADLQSKTGTKPVYRYLFSCPRPNSVAPLNNTGTADKMPKPVVGASHASEIEFAMGNLATNKVYAWTPEDDQVSATMMTYFANFIKTGNPNGTSLPKWIANKGGNTYFMNIDVKSSLMQEQDRARYLFLDQEYAKYSN